MKVNAVVQHNGDILYVPPGIFKSICPFNIQDFPFVNIYLYIKIVEKSILFFMFFFGYTKLYIKIRFMDI